MIKEVWDSFKENVKERVTNPFLGTFVLVWIIHNWEVVFSFFYFDKDTKLKSRIDYFEAYWAKRHFIPNVLIVAIITITVLIITYGFLALSRFLSNYFENVLIPFVYKISKGKTVTFEVYQLSLDKIESLEAKFEIERKAKNEALQERENLERRLYAQDEEENISDDALTESRSFFDLIYEIEDKDSMGKTLLNISKGLTFNPNDEKIDYLLKHELVELRKRISSTASTYNFTKDGLAFKKQFFETNA